MFLGTQLRVKIDRIGLTWHHGIYVGDGKVIHMSSDRPGNSIERKSYSKVHQTSLKNFAGNGNFEEVFETRFEDDSIDLLSVYLRLPRYKTVKYKRADDLAAISRARSKLGAGGYDLYGNNCEHFAVYCKTGTYSSSQMVNLLNVVTSISRGGD